MMTLDQKIETIRDFAMNAKTLENVDRAKIVLVLEGAEIETENFFIKLYELQRINSMINIMTSEDDIWLDDLKDEFNEYRANLIADAILEKIEESRA